MLFRSLESAITGTSSVFLNLVPVMTDMSASQRQAELIISVALAAGVEQFIYTSGLGAYKPERMSTWDPEAIIAKFLGHKADIEATVRNAGFKSWTIIRPGVLMTNYTSSKVKGMGDFTTTGLLETAHREVNPMPLLSPKTLGAFISAAMLDPVGFHTKEIDLADEKLSNTDIVKKLAETSGKELRVRYRTDEEIEANPGIMMTAQVATRDIGKLVDLDELKAFGFPVITFDEFLGENKAIVEEIFAKVS